MEKELLVLLEGQVGPQTFAGVFDGPLAIEQWLVRMHGNRYKAIISIDRADYNSIREALLVKSSAEIDVIYRDKETNENVFSWSGEILLSPLHTIDIS